MMELKELYKDVKPAVMIKSALDLIHEPGEVFEVRIPKTKAGTLSGYFNDTSKAALVLARENGKHQAIYATVNPVKPSLMARMENQIGISHTTTTDSEIERRRWFLLDFDPVRPTGISSTNGELAMAEDAAIRTAEWLTSLGWPEPIHASSGNGWHLMYRIDEPNDDATKIDIEFATKMLSSIFTDDKVQVDTSVHNASRIWKVYGTVSSKGSHTSERPHRVASLAKVPNVLGIVTTAQIESIARALRDAKSEEYKDMTGEYIGDMSKWLTDRGQTVVSGPRPMFGNEGQKWLLSKCAFDANHQTPMVGLVNNRPVYRCLHNSCSSYRWKEFREKIDPNYKDPDTIFARLKEWCDSDSEKPDAELLQAASATGKQLSGIIKKVAKLCTRARVHALEGFLKEERRRFLKETIGENNEKGNLVGLINRTREMQEAGDVPMYWIADYDHRIRCGKVGDVTSPKSSEAEEIALMVKYHSLGDSWVKQTHTAQVIKFLAESYRVNPLRAFLKAKRWDGVERLTTWLPHYMGTKDDEYTRAVGRKWLISAVARAMEPGCQADHMLIFEGRQGVGKSRAARIVGGQFYTEFSGTVHGNTAMKDLVAAISGKVVVEMSELATMRRAEIESLKAILTTTVDDVRLSYERDVKSYPRTCVFIGTTNELGGSYIADATGARRFWPVAVAMEGPVKAKQLEEDVDQLWAEAVEAYENHEDWFTVPRELAMLEQADRQVTVEDAEPWYPRIRNALTDPDSFAEVFHVRDEYMSGQKTGGFTVRAGSFSAILSVIIGLEPARQSGIDVIRVRKVLETIGFKKTRPSKGWQGSSYAYDLSRESQPHLWPAVIAAKNALKFPKHTREEEES
jgi:hypothetical protein